MGFPVIKFPIVFLFFLWFRVGCGPQEFLFQLSACGEGQVGLLGRVTWWHQQKHMKSVPAPSSLLPQDPDPYPPRSSSPETPLPKPLFSIPSTLTGSKGPNVDAAWPPWKVGKPHIEFDGDSFQESLYKRLNNRMQSSLGLLGLMFWPLGLQKLGFGLVRVEGLGHRVPIEHQYLFNATSNKPTSP